MNIIKARVQGNVSRLVLLGSLSAVGSLSIDAYVPALPAMGRDLHATAASLQGSMSIFVVGLAIGQIIAGAVSDAVGRRRVLLFGLGLFVAASLVAAGANTVALLLVARVVQALGAAVATVLARAITRDLYSGRELTRAFSTLMLVNGAAPVFAPVIGGLLLSFASWRSIFLLFAVIGVGLLIWTLWGLKESLPPDQRTSRGLRVMAGSYARLATDMSYLRYVLPGALVFAAMFAYIGASPFVFQNGYGLTAQQYSYFFAANGVGIVLTGQVAAFLVKRGAHERSVLALGIGTAAGGAALTLAASILRLNVGIVMIGVFVAVAAVGLTLATAASLAVSGHPSSAGAASALQGLLQFLLGGVATSVVAHAVGGIGMSGVMLGCSCLAAVLFIGLARLDAVKQRGTVGHSRTRDIASQPL